MKINYLSEKIVGLYFSASWCPPCRRFTPKLEEVYKELLVSSSNGNNDFEVVFISSDKDEESFNGYFEKMPWLAIPFIDSEKRKTLKDLFKVRGIPCLVILDKDGTKVLTEQGVKAVYDYGAKGYPFSLERLNELKEEEERLKKEQPLGFILANESRDFLIFNDEKKVKISSFLIIYVL